MRDQRFRKLLVWQKAMDFMELVYEVTKSFPREETYGMTSQLRRAATSISMNIAEGSAAGSDMEFKRFLRIAKRSAYESMCGMEIAGRLKFCSTEDVDKLLAKADEISAMLTILHKQLLQTKTYQVSESDDWVSDECHLSTDD